MELRTFDCRVASTEARTGATTFGSAELSSLAKVKLANRRQGNLAQSALDAALLRKTGGPEAVGQDSQFRTFTV